MEGGSGRRVGGQPPPNATTARQGKGSAEYVCVCACVGEGKQGEGQGRTPNFRSKTTHIHVTPRTKLSLGCWS